MEGIIFDVDGTLWDSTDEVSVSWNMAIKDHCPYKRYMDGPWFKKELGKPPALIIAKLFPELSQKEQDELSVHLYSYENKWMETAPCIIYDGVIETIRSLKDRFRLFIVSNCAAGYVEAFLKNTGLGDCIEDHLCPGDTGLLKADNIKLIMERNNVKSAVYVGDTEGDESACREANIPMIFAEYGFGNVVDEHISISSFRELNNLDYDNMGETYGEIKR